MQFRVNAGVAELADALDSGSSDRKVVWVQVPSPAIKIVGVKLDEKASINFSGSILFWLCFS
jgi:hypothetical protein